MPNRLIIDLQVARGPALGGQKLWWCYVYLGSDLEIRCRRTVERFEIHAFRYVGRQIKNTDNRFGDHT
jgi:hypothetical protein